MQNDFLTVSQLKKELFKSFFFYYRNYYYSNKKRAIRLFIRTFYLFQLSYYQVQSQLFQFHQYFAYP